MSYPGPSGIHLQSFPPKERWDDWVELDSKAWPERVLEPMDVKGVEAFGKDGCTIRTLTKTAPGKQWEVQRELRRRIILRFREEGIASPIPQRIVHTKGSGGDASLAVD